MKNRKLAATIITIAAVILIIQNPPWGKSIDKHLNYLESLKKPAILMTGDKEKQFSKLGGLPDVPEDFVWPLWKNKPLSFICQIELSKIPLDYIENDMPRTGFLYVFYDQEQSTWGFDPNDKGSWRLYYTETLQAVRRAEKPKDLEIVYKEKHVKPNPFYTYPDWQDERIEQLKLTNKQADTYIDLCFSVYGDEPMHQLFGYPYVVQNNDMDLECQLATNGIYCGDATGYKNPRRKELESGRKDWILLLQIDSDDDTEMMWGDVGILYFWIKKADLKERKFENVWMILQCY